MARPTSGSGKSGYPSSAAIRLPMKVWDLATRLFHWLLLATFLTSYLSVTFADGPNAAPLMQIHLWSGEFALFLLVFRLIWGVVGSETSRFAQFLRSPMQALAHLRGLFVKSPDDQIGHNAAGGWMVVILLLLLTIQVGTGLFSNDDGTTQGPLAHFVGKPVSDQISDLHSFNFNLLMAAVLVHVVVIGLYARLKGQNLLAPMISGKKRLPAATRAPRLANPLLAVVVAAVSAGIVLLLIYLS